MNILRIIVLAVLVTCWLTPARAGGFFDAYQSANAAGVATAGATAIAEDAATVFYNPAGMTSLARPEVLVGFGLSFPSTSFQNSGTTDPAGFHAMGNTKTNATDFF